MEKKHYLTGDAETDKIINELAQKYGNPHNRYYFRELFTSIIKLSLDKADNKDLFLTNVALKELRYIFKTFSPFRDTKKVVIFGSHISSPKSQEYKMAQAFAKKIVKEGFMVITGGGGGVMEAGNCGAGKEGFAVKIQIAGEEKPNPYVNLSEKLVNVRYFFTRKLAFLKESDATVLFPGGFGTQDEGFEVLTLLRTGKTPPRPLLFIENPGGSYWKDWLKYLKKEFLGGGYIEEEDLVFIKIVNSVEAAVKEIKNFYRNYHSVKYGREITIIRLNRKIPVSALNKIGKKYQDFIEGEIRPSGPLPDEVREKEWLNLPRICMHIKRKDFGRLTQLIHDLNRV